MSRKRKKREKKGKSRSTPGKARKAGSQEEPVSGDEDAGAPEREVEGEEEDERHDDHDDEPQDEPEDPPRGEYGSSDDSADQAASEEPDHDERDSERDDDSDDLGADLGMAEDPADYLERDDESEPSWEDDLADEFAGDPDIDSTADSHGDSDGDGSGVTDGEGVTYADIAERDRRIKHILESLLFAADKPLPPQRLGTLVRHRDSKLIRTLLGELAEEYRDRGIVLHEVAGGWQFRTASQNAGYVQALIGGRPVRLSRAQLETMAIVAYRQPITRPEIDDIRGVDSGGTLKVLLDRQLVRVLGKKEEPGRPLLYGTTKEFLAFFNLSDLRELPTLREYHELTEDSMRVVERMGMDVDELASAAAEAGAYERAETEPAGDLATEAQADRDLVEETWSDEDPVPDSAGHAEIYGGPEDDGDGRAAPDHEASEAGDDLDDSGPEIAS